MATAAEIAEIVRKVRELETGHVQLKDLFTRAITSQGTSASASQGQARLNFREAERHMPKDYNGKSVTFAEFCFKIESYMTALDPSGRGGEIVKKAAELDDVVDDDVLAAWDTEYWHAQPLGAALASCLITTTTGEVATLVRRILRAEPGAGFRAWQELIRWFRPKSVIEGSSSMARIIEPAKCKTVSDLQRAVMAWELKVVEHEARFNEVVPESVKVAALRRMLTPEMAERYMEGPNAYPELRARVGVYIGEKLVQSGQGAVPMDIGECDDDPVEAVNVGRRTREAQSSGQSQRPARADQPRTPKPTAGEKRAADDQGKKDVDDRRKAKKKDLVCYNCGGKGHPARLCPSPSANAVDDEVGSEGDEEQNDSGGLCCGVAWADSLDNCGDEEDTVFAVSRDGSRRGEKWQRIAAVVDSGAAENVLPPDVCKHLRATPTDKSRAGIGFRGAGGDKIQNFGKKEFRVKLVDGTVLDSTWHVAGVKRPLMSVGKMLAAGSKVYLEDTSPRVVLAKGKVVPLRRVGNVFLIDLWVRGPAQGFARQG